MLTIEDVFKNLKVKLTPEREKLIRQAYVFAKEAHAGQKRKSGDDYIEHSLGTAVNLAKIGMRSKTIVAGLLHDVIEDTNVTLEKIKNEFGQEIAFIIEGVTKLGKIKLRGTKEQIYLENLRRMFLAMASDIRVVIIKLADRLHNMETLEFLPEEKRERIAMETMEIFVPIANRLGIGEVKVKLEDLAFKYLDQENHDFCKKIIDDSYISMKKAILEVIYHLKNEFRKEKIEVVEIYGRTKSIFSFCQKLKKHEMDANKVYDLAGIRIVVPEVADCYKTLGIVHKNYHPMVGRIKDYISLPKPNGYQSIHTTIFGPEGKMLEIQIRTPRMHAEAEFGIAAHWIYAEKKRDWRSLLKLGKSFIVRKEAEEENEKEIIWIKQLQNWQNDLGKNDEEFMEGLKIEFFKNHILAFTPKGDIIDLPEESTPIDFAYKLHSEIGNRATGAKADRKMVPLDYKIKNGEVIEIITSKDHKMPNQDWLRFVRTSNAKSHIRKFYKNT